MHQEKYSLTWHTYSDHLKSMMKELMMNEDYSDVTLVTEDKKHMKANINVLSACSPVFKDILKKENNSSKIMYFRGIQSSEIESIIQFIYLGEATFYQERMDEFLAVAKSLEIKELCAAKFQTKSETEGEPSPTVPETFMEETKSETENEPTPTEEETKSEPEDEPSPTVPEPETFMEDVIEETIIPNGRTKQAPQQRKGNVKVHTNGKYECEQCHKTYSARSNLYAHKKSFHMGVKYACDQCDFKATTQENVRIHIQSKHEGIKYPCDQCEYQARYLCNLIVHIQSKHEGIKYDCSQCPQQFSNKSNLANHIKLKHQIKEIL